MIDQAILDVQDLTPVRAADLRADLLQRTLHLHRTAKRRRNTAASAAVAVVGTALGYAALAPTSTFASWTEVPSPLQVGIDDPIVDQCLLALPDGPAKLIGRAAPTPVLGERRGNFNAVLLGASDSISVCISDDTSRASGRTRAPALSPDEAISLIGNGGSLDEEGARYVYGRVAVMVTGVDVRTSGGMHVTASVTDGYYLAWWPAPDAPASITASGARGVVQVIAPE